MPKRLPIIDPPGSPVARGKGCLCCPRLNFNGEGSALGRDAEGYPLFELEGACPLHGLPKYRQGYVHKPQITGRRF